MDALAGWTCMALRKESIECSKPGLHALIWSCEELADLPIWYK